MVSSEGTLARARYDIAAHHNIRTSGDAMEWYQILSTKRFGRENDDGKLTGGRTAFESDIDRILFSGSFRRLGRKTQVHPLVANDHIHTRLTHSLEVSSVGRALGKALGAKIVKELPAGISESDLATIVQAACLAHDIGNPPFGHAGESAMADWFEQNGPKLFENLSPDYKHDIIGFDGNAQGFRVLTQTENHLFEGGLQLTYATLGSFLKYPWSSHSRKRKFGSFISELPNLQRIADELGLASTSEFHWCRHPLAYLVEAADDICYAVIDLEDAVELRILQFEAVRDFLLELFDGAEKNRVRSMLASPMSHRVNLARLRGPVFDRAIEAAIEAYMVHYSDIMSGSYGKNLFESFEEHDPRRRLIFGAKEIARERVFRDSKKVEVELGCYSTFDTLLDAFCIAALNQAEVLNNPQGEETLRLKSELVLQLLGDHAPSKTNEPPGSSWSAYQCLRRVIDFVSGMTDSYAVYVANQLQGMGFSGLQRP